jgi:hypothetical protein
MAMAAPRVARTTVSFMVIELGKDDGASGNDVLVLFVCALEVFWLSLAVCEHWSQHGRRWSLYTFPGSTLPRRHVFPIPPQEEDHIV